MLWDQYERLLGADAAELMLKNRKKGTANTEFASE